MGSTISRERKASSPAPHERSKITKSISHLGVHGPSRAESSTPTPTTIGSQLDGSRASVQQGLRGAGVIQGAVGLVKPKSREQSLSPAKGYNVRTGYFVPVGPDWRPEGMEEYERVPSPLSNEILREDIELGDDRIDIINIEKGGAVVNLYATASICQHVQSILSTVGHPAFRVAIERFGYDANKLACGYCGFGPIWASIRNTIEDEGWEFKSVSYSGCVVAINVMKKKSSPSDLELSIMQRIASMPMKLHPSLMRTIPRAKKPKVDITGQATFTTYPRSWEKTIRVGKHTNKKFLKLFAARKNGQAGRYLGAMREVLGVHVRTLAAGPENHRVLKAKLNYEKLEERMRIANFKDFVPKA